MKEIKIQSDSELQMYGPLDCLNGICEYFWPKPAPEPTLGKYGDVLHGYYDTP